MFPPGRVYPLTRIVPRPEVTFPIDTPSSPIRRPKTLPGAANLHNVWMPIAAGGESLRPTRLNLGFLSRTRQAGRLRP